MRCRRDAGVVDELGDPVHTLTGGGWWRHWLRWNSCGRFDPNALA